MTTTAAPARRKLMIPLGNRILVRPTEPPEKKGDLFIPNQAREQPMEGVVVATSADLTVFGHPIDEGMTVLYGKYAGQEVKFNEETLLILRLDTPTVPGDVLGIVEDADTE